MDGVVPRETGHSRVDAPSGPLSAYGTALHGLAVAGLAGGDPSAVRLLVVAERLGVLREFQPTMSAERAQRMAENADGAGRVAGGGPRCRSDYFGSRLNLEVDQK
jgi:hypothetical protein